MKTTLKVVHVDSERGWRGGENQLLLLATGLQARGHRNLIIAQPGVELIRRARKAGVATAEIRMWGEWDPIARARVRRAVRRFGADVVHAHTPHAHLLALAAAGKGGGRPRPVISRRVDFPVARNFWSRRKYLSPLCRYIAISNGVRDVLVANGVAPDRVRVVHSGVDLERFTFDRSGDAFRLEIGCGRRDLLVGNVGALTDHKGHVYLVEAAAKVIAALPNARFCVVGDGELKSSLLAKARERNLGGRFRFVGYRQDVEECLAAFDLFALSSHLEGLCTSLIDAMLLGVPIVATRTGGVPDLVTHEETGLLVPPKDPEALAEAILRMLRDEGLRQRLAAAARANALENFTAEQMVEGTERTYREILNEK